MNAYLAKPVEPAELRRILEQVLKSRSGDEET
jgi:CheY-like chemotaxis protein